MRSDAIRPGEVIGGKYRVRAILSRKRGFLVEAFHTEFDQRVVIRVLSPTLCDEKEVERFRREARTLAKLESEHVARILDIGTLPDGAFFFARPYLEGTDLAAHLKQRGTLPLAEATLLLLQASEAVAETHVHNIILRELQPSHLFLSHRVGGEPLLKVIDFGTAKLMRESAAPTAGGELTSTSMFGLSCYSSPELIRKAKHVDVRTDVWSLGAIFYQMLSGRPPFDGEMAALMLQISRDDPPPLTRFRRDLPAEVNQIIGWAMAKDPDGRFANVHAFAHALSPFATAEAKVLIQRIGTITSAAKKRQKSAPLPATMDPNHPQTLDGDELIEDEPEDIGEAPTRIKDTDALAEVRREVGGKIPEGTIQMVPSPLASKGQAGESPLEQTVFMGANYVPASPASPLATRSAQPSASVQVNLPPLVAPPVAPPMSPPVFGGGAAGIQRPGGSQPPGPLGPPPQFSAPTRQTMPSNPSDQAVAASPGLAMTPGSAVPRAPKPPPKGAQIAVIALAGTVAALLAAVVFVLVRSPGDPPPDALATAQSAAATASAVASSAPVGVAAPAAEPSAIAAAAAPPTAESSAIAAPPSAASTGTKVAGGPGPASPAPLSTTKPAAGKPTASAAAAAPPPTDSEGTLVAVAVGGTCAFSVNGASKGTMSKLKMQVKPGTYSVTCKPSTGATKSKSVTIASGGTAMAMFKLE